MKNILTVTLVAASMCGSLAMAQTQGQQEVVFNRHVYSAQIAAADGRKLPVMIMADVTSVIGLCSADVVRSVFTLIDRTIAKPVASNREELKSLRKSVWSDVVGETQMKVESSECRTSTDRTGISFSEGYERVSYHSKKAITEFYASVKSRLNLK